MHIVKVKRDGKLDIIQTLTFNFGPRTAKKDRRTLSEIIAQRKRATRDARLVQIITR